MLIREFNNFPEWVDWLLAHLPEVAKALHGRRPDTGPQFLHALMMSALDPTSSSPGILITEDGFSFRLQNGDVFGRFKATNIQKLLMVYYSVNASTLEHLREHDFHALTLEFGLHQDERARIKHMVGILNGQALFGY